MGVSFVHLSADRLLCGFFRHIVNHIATLLGRTSPASRFARTQKTRWQRLSEHCTNPYLPGLLPAGQRFQLHVPARAAIIFAEASLN